jgi:hypothetical protein
MRDSLRFFAITFAVSILSHGSPALATSVAMQKFVANDGANSDQLGLSVAISKDWAVGGAKSSAGKGAVYVLKRGVQKWEFSQKLVPGEAAAKASFGQSVATFGQTLLVGAPDEDAKGKRSGAVYVFQNENGSWKQTDKIVPDDAQEEDFFGKTLAHFGEKIAIGAPGCSDKGKYSGAVYVYSFHGKSLTKEAKLVAADGSKSDSFGSSISIAKNWLIVGAYQKMRSSGKGGAAYIFQRQQTEWREFSKLTPKNDHTNFGVSVAISERTAVVGADNDSKAANHSGAAYVYQWKDRKWVPESTLAAKGAKAFEGFGSSVYVAENSLLVGSMRGSENGAVDVFRPKGKKWGHASRMIDKQGKPRDFFGTPIAYSDGFALFGAQGADDKGDWSGALYFVKL